MQSTTSDSLDSLASGISAATDVKVSGEVCVDISYNTKYNMLELLIMECRNLAAASGKYSNPYVFFVFFFLKVYPICISFM
jgi:hypothetical protein